MASVLLTLIPGFLAQFLNQVRKIAQEAPIQFLAELSLPLFRKRIVRPQEQCDALIQDIAERDRHVLRTVRAPPGWSLPDEERLALFNGLGMEPGAGWIINPGDMNLRSYLGLETGPQLLPAGSPAVHPLLLCGTLPGAQDSCVMVGLGPDRFPLAR